MHSIDAFIFPQTRVYKKRRSPASDCTLVQKGSQMFPVKYVKMYSSASYAFHTCMYNTT
eukprot:jgi/Botrbrau1/7772/Bobra.0159s0200.1